MNSCRTVMLPETATVRGIERAGSRCGLAKRPEPDTLAMLRKLGWLLVVLMMTPGCAPTAPQTPAPTGEGMSDGINPGDLIDLRVWREEDWTGQFPVEEDGTVVLPRVGRYDVRSETGRSLQERLVRELGTVLRNPSISVRVLRRVKVLGAVHEPGLQYVDRTMTIGDAVALAGGATPEAKRNTVALYREGKEVRGGITEGTRLSDLPLQSGDEIFVPAKTWLAQNLAAVLGVVASMAGIAVTLLTRPKSSGAAPAVPMLLPTGR